MTNLLHKNSHSSIWYDAHKNELIKSINENYPSESDIQKLRNEFELLQDLQVEGVRKALDFTIENNQPRLYLEYIEGQNLRDFFKNNTLALQDKLDLLIQLCHILHKVHHEGIIHKDINPSNILISNNKRVYLIDFEIASRFTLRRPNLGNPEKLEGTLRYISPEQTGRMNRSVDYRTDLYSLGATLFELFTDEPPFQETNAINLVHAHLAKTPAYPSDIKATIPPMLSEVILKLLAKNPENRYQSAFGLMKDLEKCHELLVTQGAIVNFELGQEDFSGKLQIPEKLYGRENERTTLLEAFQRVKSGSVELTMVAGYSGTGKSVLISETHRPLTATKGYFIEGKFDQFQRNIPFFAWIQAFKSFADLLLTENEDTLKYWKDTILEAVGNNGAVLTEVIPNLELIIGKQPALEQIGGQEALNRFNYVMQNFVKAITTQDHPLIIFIDDLQWADRASLNLLKTLVTDKDNTHLLCVGAYRDNEVSKTHPLVNTLSEIEDEANNINEITIGNLSERAILSLLSDTLKHPQSINLENLNKAILSKTGGNAFFTHQFLKSLYEEELLVFSFENKQWQWDMNAIVEARFTDNVVELMVKKVEKLPENSRKLLELAACIGNKFTSKTLRIISGQQAIHKDLDKAILEGLLIPVGNGQYKFVHDRIQQAAYSLIPAEAKKRTHLEIGQLLYQSLDEKTIAENIFDIVGHYNFAQELFNEEDRKAALVLNQQATLKAKASASFDGMLNYIQKAMELLPENSWETAYNTTLKIYQTLLDAEYYNQNYDNTGKYVDTIVEKASDLLDKAKAQYMLLRQTIYLGKQQEAIEYGFQILKLLGIERPDINNPEFVDAYLFQEVIPKLQNVQKTIGINNLPENNSSKITLIIELLIWLSDPAIQVNDPITYKFCWAKGTDLSLEHGNCSASFSHYTRAAVISVFSGDYQTAVEIGEMSYKKALETDKKTAVNIGTTFSNWCAHWRKPIAYGKQLALTNMELALDIGENEYYSYSIFSYIIADFADASNLGNIKKEIEENSWDYVLKHSNQMSIGLVGTMRWIINRVVIDKISDLSFQGQTFNEEAFEQYFIENQEYLVLAVYYTYKSQMLYIMGEPEKALPLLQQSHPLIPAIITFTAVFDNNLFTSLTFLHEYEKTSNESLMEIVNTNQAQMKVWADNCEENFLHKYQLVEAEKARVAQQNWYEVLEYYEQAIESARQNGFIQDAALANELCAQYLMSIDKQKIAVPYLKEAYNLYKSWGATAKTAQMKTEYAHIFNKKKKANLTTTYVDYHTISSTTTTKHGLDLDTILKANASLSKQVRLDDLIKEMLGLLRRNSGASKITFLRKEEEQWLVDTDQENEQQLIERPVLLEEYTKLPKQVITYTLRSKDVVLSDQLANEAQFQKDAYVKEKQSKSVLVVPVKRKEEIIALLYLENSLNTGVFHKKRVELVKALATQLAISMENTLLYQNLEDKVEMRTRELQESNEELQVMNEELRQTQEELHTQRDYVAEKNKVLEEFNTKISGSLKVAQTIQEAMLPYQEKLDNLLKNYFIINRPKDVVSGDFYWLNEIERKTILVVADCTGHGIPGAFMTLIGSNLLDKIIRLRKITHPADILSRLHEEIKSVLKQRYTSNNQGMDAVVVTLEPQGEQILMTFAGAKNNICYTLQGELHELKGTRKSIGGFQDEVTQFNSQQITLPKGSMLYLGSDGLEDQNNQERKKFGRKRLQQLLSSIAHLSLVEQQIVIEQTLGDFMLGTEQRDDILWLGLRL